MIAGDGDVIASTQRVAIPEFRFRGGSERFLRSYRCRAAVIGETPKDHFAALRVFPETQGFRLRGSGLVACDELSSVRQ
jgi:hypothetical protein